MKVIIRKLRFSLNDGDRVDWINGNDELYEAWQESRMPLRAFVARNRDTIDEDIHSALGMQSIVLSVCNRAANTMP